MPRSLASGEGEEGHPGMREQQSRGSEVCAGQGVGGWGVGIEMAGWAARGPKPLPLLAPGSPGFILDAWGRHGSILG